MGDLLLLGTLFALGLCFFHVVYIYDLVKNTAPTKDPAVRFPALYFSLWTFALWLLLGAYLIVFWLISVIFYVVFKAFRQ